MYTQTSIDVNGKPLQTITGRNAENVQACKHPDEISSIEGSPKNISKYYWDFLLEMWVKQIERPSPNHAFNWVTKQWYDPRSLQDFKNDKLREIKQARKAAEDASFQYKNMNFDGDEEAQRLLNTYAAASRDALADIPPYEAQIALADDTVVTLTGADFIALAKKKTRLMANAIARGAALRGQIKAAKTREAVDAIVW